MNYSHFEADYIADSGQLGGVLGQSALLHPLQETRSIAALSTVGTIVLDHAPDAVYNDGFDMAERWIKTRSAEW